MDSTNPRPGDPLPESRFSVILVEPQYPDNVGHTARSLLNFGVGELHLVNMEIELDAPARDRAVHAQPVLDQAHRHASLADVRDHFDILVGFAARVSTLDKAHLRMSEPLEVVARRIETMGGRVGLVFGREDFGLSNEDVERCDILCTIPTAPSYRSMNLSHAVTVALYEMTRTGHTRAPYVSMATVHEKAVLLSAWRHLTKRLGFPAHRTDQNERMLQRLIGRAGLTSWEYHRFMGTVSRSLKTLHAWPPPGVGEGRWTRMAEADADVDDAAEDEPGAE